MRQIVLGLYLGESLTQAVLLQLNASSAELLAIREWPSRLFEFAGDDTPGIDELSDQLSEIIAQAPAHPSHAAIAIDSSKVFITVFPFPGSATRDQITQQVHWELSQYYPDDPYRGFISDFHILPGRHEMQSKKVMCVAVRRDRIDRIRKVLTRVNLEPALVDVDHFSADVAMRRNYPDTGGKFIAFFGVKAARLDASFIRYNDLESYTYALHTGTSSVVARIQSTVENIKGLSHIMLYGSDLTGEIIEGVRSAMSLPVEVTNPLRTIDIAAPARSEGAHLQQSHRFAAAIGVAMRRD